MYDLASNEPVTIKTYAYYSVHNYLNEYWITKYRFGERKIIYTKLTEKEAKELCDMLNQYASWEM